MYVFDAMYDVWYNAFDGVKIGPNIRGHYLNKYHVFQANLWTNTVQNPKKYGTSN